MQAELTTIVPTKHRVEVFKDDQALDTWHVQAFEDGGEGLCYFTIFVGVDAESRAHEYAAWKYQQTAIQFAA